MSEKHALVASHSIPEGDRDSGSRRRLDLIDFLRDAGYAITFVAASPITNHGAADLLHRRGITVRDGMLKRKPAAAPEPVLYEGLAAHPVDLALLAEWAGRGVISADPPPGLSKRVGAGRFRRSPLFASCAAFVCRSRRRSRVARRRPRGAVDRRVKRLCGRRRRADRVPKGSRLDRRLLRPCRPDLLCPGRRRLSPQAALPFSERRGMLVLGNYQYPPNVDGVEFPAKRSCWTSMKPEYVNILSLLLVMSRLSQQTGAQEHAACSTGRLGSLGHALF